MRPLLIATTLLLFGAALAQPSGNLNLYTSQPDADAAASPATSVRAASISSRSRMLSSSASSACQTWRISVPSSGPLCLTRPSSVSQLRLRPSNSA